MTDTIEMCGCEHCGKDFPFDDNMVRMADCWFCGGCYAEWKAEFDKCEHAWEPEDSEFGEPGRYCHKCCGFQLLDAHSETPLTGGK